MTHKNVLLVQLETKQHKTALCYHLWLANLGLWPLTLWKRIMFQERNHLFFFFSYYSLNKSIFNSFYNNQCYEDLRSHSRLNGMFYMISFCGVKDDFNDDSWGSGRTHHKLFVTNTCNDTTVFFLSWHVTWFKYKHYHVYKGRPRRVWHNNSVILFH